MDLDTDRVARTLAQRGLRLTRQRRAVLEAVAAAPSSLSPLQVYDAARETCPELGLTTVYRTLDVLEDLGIVRHHHGPEGREEFHVLPDTDHGHLHCRSCGRSWEVGAAEVAPMIDALRERRGFEADISHMSLVGRCADCVGRPLD